MSVFCLSVSLFVCLFVCLFACLLVCLLVVNDVDVGFVCLFLFCFILVTVNH